MNSRKVFAVDNAIPNRLGFRFSENRGRLLENAVFIELQRRGCEVYYFSGKQECDFLIKENLTITEAVQVTVGLNAENANREIGGISEAMKSFNIPKGTVVVFDDNHYPVELPKGVTVIPAHEWFMAAFI
jgi:predicted AAA+ superfamily ATPase